MVLFHRHQPKAKQIFTRQDVDPWEMVNFLVEIHAEESVGLYLAVCPPNIPISAALFLLYDPSKLFSDFFDDRVLRIWDIDNYFFGPRFVAQFRDWNVFGGIVSINLDWTLGWIIVTLVSFGSVFALHYFILVYSQ